MSHPENKQTDGNLTLVLDRGSAALANNGALEEAG
jgi:hypothetical protein